MNHSPNRPPLYHRGGFLLYNDFSSNKPMANPNWRSLIAEELKENNDSWDNVVSCTLTEKELLETFYDGYGSEEGKPFTLWTKTKVYFPVAYDGAEWVGSVSRNPDEIPTRHLGGG